MTQSLAIDPERVLFDEDGEKSLLKALDTIESRTVHSELTSPTDIQLDDRGRLKRGGSKFTTLALAQLCQGLGPGLSKLIFSVAGLHREPGDSDTPVSVPLAVKIINEMTRLRFDAIQGKQLIHDTKTGLVEGLTGAGYLFLSNKEFYDQVCDAVSSVERPCVFHEAILSGRKLTVYYRHKNPVASFKGWVSGQDNFYTGFDLTNSEAGECAVKLAPVLLVDSMDAVCLRGPKRRRLVHSGARFASKLATNLHKTFDERETVFKIDKRLETLRQMSLGFSMTSEESHNQLFQKYVGALCQQKLTLSLSSRIMRMAVYHSDRRSSQTGYLMSGLNARTKYDLLLSLMCEARRVTPGIQELVEKTAYNLLTKKLPLPETGQ